MTRKTKPSTSAANDPATAAPPKARYVLKLYVTSTTPQSGRAIVNIRKICEEHLQGRYDLEVVNVAEHPALAADEQIIAAPTLIKKLPLPLRRFIGDMSQTDRIVVGLNLEPK
ncbi:MAG: circadian clock KaiB family protein [Chthoniobacteraceae bacterium]